MFGRSVGPSSAKKSINIVDFLCSFQPKWLYFVEFIVKYADMYMRKSLCGTRKESAVQLQSHYTKCYIQQNTSYENCIHTFFFLLEYFVEAGNVCNPKSNSLSHLIVIYCTFCKIFILISSAIRCDFGLFVFCVSMNLCSVSPDTHQHIPTHTKKPYVVHNCASRKESNVLIIL